MDLQEISNRIFTISKALTPTCLSLISLLFKYGELNQKQIVYLSKMKQSTVSYAMTRIVKSGLITKRKYAHQVFYSLNYPFLDYLDRLND